MAERRAARSRRDDDELDGQVSDRATRTSDPDEAGDDPDARPRRRGRSRDASLSAEQAARTGLRQIAELTGRQPEGVTGVEPAEDGWVVGIEVVEDRRVPSSADILAVYETEFDMTGELLSYRRVRRYPRGRGDRGSEES